MKTLFATFAALALSAGLAFADTVPATAVACGTDGQQVTLSYTWDNSIQHPVVAHVQAAFQKAATGRTAEELITQGAGDFKAALDEYDYDAIDITDNPTITGTCKAS